MFLNGFADYINDELATPDLPTGLNELISLAVWVDQRFRARRKERNHARSVQAQLLATASPQVLSSQVQAP